MSLADLRSSQLPRFEGDFRSLLPGELQLLPFQRLVATHLANRRHVLLRAPTGAGKTLSVIAPFLLMKDLLGVRRMIYTLPMRTLADGIYEDADELVIPRQMRAAIQTGSRPEDPFFDQGDIVVCTYDQLLSGFLCGPYGLPDKLYNINAAAVAGNLVVFDEFHLMDAHRAFRTAVECIELYNGTSLSVWMTATATTPLCRYLKEQLQAVEVELTPEELEALYKGRGIRRILRRVHRPLTVDEILLHSDRRTLVVVNRVARAQQLYRDAERAGLGAVLLHSRFFAADRDRQRLELKAKFGKTASGPALAIATQVVEAGLDLSAEVLLTELCPMNALVQRSGRCARFASQQGVVSVYDVDSVLPYDDAILNATHAVLQDGMDLEPAVVSQWVEAVHAASDQHALESTTDPRLDVIRRRIAGPAARDSRISQYIREDSDTVRLIICTDPLYHRASEFQSVAVWRNQLRSLEPLSASAWYYAPDQEGFWARAQSTAELLKSYIVCLSPQIARYSPQEGLVVAASGTMESYPAEDKRAKNVAYQYRREPWRQHTDSVVDRARARIEEQAGANSLLAERYSPDVLLTCVCWAAELHDLGKLQVGWDAWAHRYQAARDSGYVHAAPLAHTDFDPRNPADWQALRVANQQGNRPPHAAASAMYGRRKLSKLPKEQLLPVLYAIVSHHGGSWQTASIGKLIVDGEPPMSPVEEDRFNQLGLRLSAEIREHWALASYLVRTLRLADQKATQDYQRE